MDDPRISQSLNSSLKPVQPGKKSNAATEQSGASTESTAQAGAAKGKQVSRTDFASIGDTALTNLADLLPMEVLSSPGLQRAEWAWRQIIADSLTKWAFQKSQLSHSYTRTGQIAHEENGSLSGSGSVSENVMQAWWQMLASWAGSTRQNASGRVWVRADVQALQSQTQYGLVPFSQVTSATYGQLPRGVQHEVLLDRILSAVTAENMPQVGSGVFVPQFQVESDRNEAVQWYAERTARLNRHGQILDRLSLRFSLHDWPVEIVFLSAQPALYVHVRSNHPNVHKLASSAQPLLSDKLRTRGWNLEQWTVSQWIEEDEK